MTAHTEPRRVAKRAHFSPWAWLGTALAVGFAVPFLFADVLDLPRDAYYGIHAIATITLFAAWLRDRGTTLSSVVLARWPWGVVVGIAGAVVTTFAVLRVEESTAHPGGFEFAVAVVWRGLVYGAVDGLLLAVFPILVVYAALEPHRRKLLGKAAVGAAALVASLAMTAIYHVGYAEFRDADLAKPVGGNPAWSLPTLLTANPIASPIAHAAMHVTAVVESYETEVFLPPHERP
jgi:hypothetical protein